MWSATFTGMWSRKRRLIGMTTAVVLGVAFLVATLIIGDTMNRGFRATYEHANAGFDVDIRSATVIGRDPELRGTIDADLADTVAAVPGVAAVVPTVGGPATVLGVDGDPVGGNGPPTLGGTWITDGEVNPYALAEGRAPSGPDEVVIDRRTADLGDLAVGDVTKVLVPDPVEVTVVGIATFGDDDSFGPMTFAGFAPEVAAELFAPAPGQVSELRVVAQPGVDAEALRAAVVAVLPDSTEALTSAQLTDDQQARIQSDVVSIFERMLLAFAGIALVVATFSIHNTFSILVAQRTRESALLRAVGASRIQLLGGVTVEALVIGVVASALGLGVGYGLATGLDAAMGGLGLSFPGGLAVAPATFVVAAVVGLATTLVASISPAIKAARVSPLEALREAAVDRSATSIVRAALGATLTVAGVLGVLTATTADGPLARVGLGSLAVVIGVVVLGPTLARPAAASIGQAAALTRGFTGRLARRNAMRNPRRVASSAASLMVGTAVVALFATFGASIKRSVDQEVSGSFSGDLVILPPGLSGAGLSRDLATDLDALPEVDRALGMAFGVARVDGENVYPAAADPAQLAAAFDLDESAGSVAELRPGEIAISADYAGDHGLGLGDPVTMSFVDGSTVTLTVDAVYRRTMSFGDLVMNRADWDPHAGTAGDTVAFVTLADGVSLDAGKAAVGAVTDRFGAPDPQDRDEYLGTVSSQIDQMLFIVYGLLGVAVLIAVVGIANTLALSIHERTRELGLLRAVGQSRSQTRTTVRWEAVIVAVFGTITGVAMGTFLGWGIMRAVHASEGFGEFAAPWRSLGVIVALAAAAGVAASLRPARRAGRTDILAALATE